MIADDWNELCETLRQMAEGYASTDPTNAWQYRQDADEFCALKSPIDEGSLTLLEAEAAAVKLRWGNRLRDSGEIRCGGAFSSDEKPDSGL